MTANPRPYALIAELTYRCPLRCVYCSNPTNYSEHLDQLNADQWLSVMREAEAIGVLQVLLSGGEPLLRKDLELIVAGAAALKLYTNLITSGIPLERQRLERLRSAGLDSVQISIQDTNVENSETICGRDVFAQKLEVAQWVKQLGMPLTVNVVLHRGNIDRIADMIALAESLKADRLELANAQYLAWALLNRDQLLPSKEQLSVARTCALQAKQRLLGQMEILFVLPDYYSDRPKACMNGWGRRYIVISPDGLALPCHLAHTIAGMKFDNVTERSLAEIWANSSAFQAYRGQDWMLEPCRTCDQRSTDFGGCRCQAFHLTGDARTADPACALSPAHHLVSSLRRPTDARPWVGKLLYRHNT